MKKKYLIFSGLTFLALTANAQKLQEVTSIGERQVNILVLLYLPGQKEIR